MITVGFNQLEKWALWEIAGRRQKTTRVSDGTLDGHSWRLRWYKGLRGEYAAARYLGVDIDVATGAKGDDGSDFMFRGYSVDVKYLQDWLLSSKARPFNAEIAVLTRPVRADEKLVELTAWCWKRDFDEKSFEKDLGYGPLRAMKAEDMRPIETMFDITPKHATHEGGRE